MTMSLEEYDRRVGFHLKMIQSLAKQIDTHVGYMVAQPGFDTMAEDDLEKIDGALAHALGIVRFALSRFREKPRDE